MEHSREPELKNLIIKGKRQGFLTYEEINDHLPDRLSDVEHVESIVNMLNEMEVEVLDAPPDPDSLILNAEESMDEENVAEEAEEVLKSEFGSTTDPVRMYMREMGAIDLLTRDKEIELAKRIQSGLHQAKEALSTCPLVFRRLIYMFDRIEGESMRITELFSGFVSEIKRPVVSNDDEEEEGIGVNNLLEMKERARKEMIEANLRLVVSIAKTNQCAHLWKWQLKPDYVRQQMPR